MVTCANTAKGGRVGGITGQFDCQVTNCYNTGEIHLSKTSGDKFNYVGGIAGDYDYSGGHGDVINCYNIGSITYESTPSASTSIGTGPGDGPQSNCYHLDTVEAAWIFALGSTARTADEMKSASLVAVLGDAFNGDRTAELNDGYPVLAWQGGEAVYKVALTEGGNYTITAAEGYETAFYAGADFRCSTAITEADGIIPVSPAIRPIL